MTSSRSVWPHPARADVAVLDPDGPPGVAFIRALGRRAVPVDAFTHERLPAGRTSRHLRWLDRSPSPYDTDRYVDWLADRMARDDIGLVAPTSDYAVFAAAAAMDLVGIDPPPGISGLAATWSCLHKGEFATHMERIGFPTVPQRLPTSLDDALVAADELGYPVMVKPRTHVGVGLARGGIARDERELRTMFREADVTGAGRTAVSLDPDLGWPMIQAFRGGDHVDVVSVSGCLGPGGEVWAIGGCRKLAQWPPGAGIGSLFESYPIDDVTELAVAAVRSTLGAGIFELEVLVDRRTGERWPIDLNPRAYGQVALEIARGNDLPGLWYRLATGISLRSLPIPRTPPEVWQSGLTHLPGALIDVATGPDRRARAGALRTLMRRPRVGAMYDRDDPLPALVLGANLLSSPTTVIRPFLPSRRRPPAEGDAV